VREMAGASIDVFVHSGNRDPLLDKGVPFLSIVLSSHGGVFFGTMLDKFCHIGMIFLSWVCPAALAGCFLAFTSVVVVVVESDNLSGIAISG